MAVVARGWSRTASTAVKLATAERIIGYQFKDVGRLYEALDQYEHRSLLPSGKVFKERRRNTRLALVGDSQARLYMAQKWYDQSDLAGADWSKINEATLSNQSLSQIGFRLGLDECAITTTITREYDMASTVEALIAAVKMDGAGQEQVNKVMVRFGLEHRSLDPIQRLWIYQAVKSKLSLPDRFFVGHHFQLQKDIFETHLKRPIIKRRETRQLGRVFGLWEFVKKLWRGRGRKPRKKHPRLQSRPQVVFRSLAQPKEGVKPLWEERRPTPTRELSPPTKDVAPSEPKILGEQSAGRSEGNKPAAAPEQTADREDPVEEHEAAEESPSQAPKPSQPPKRRRGLALLKKGAAADDDRVPDTSSPGSNKARKDQTAAESPNTDGVTTSTEKKVSNKACKDQTAAESSNKDGMTTSTEKKVSNKACKDQKAADSSKRNSTTTSTDEKVSNEASKDQTAAESSNKDGMTTSTEKKVSNKACKDQKAANSSKRNSTTTSTDEKVSNKASKDQTAAESSNKDGATTGTEKISTIQAHGASGAVSVEATEEPIEVFEEPIEALEEPIEAIEEYSKQILEEKLEMVVEMAKRAKSRQMGIESAFRELKLTKKKRDPAHLQVLLKVREQRQLIERRRRKIKDMLNRLS